MEEYKFGHGFLEIEKAWGKEEIVVSNELYCFKRLSFNKGGALSMHFHVDKHETWEIISGRGLFAYYNYATGKLQTRILREGDVVTIPNHQLHRFEAHEDTIINEVSTQDKFTDSYRTIPSGKVDVDK